MIDYIMLVDSVEHQKLKQKLEVLQNRIDKSVRFETWVNDVMVASPDEKGTKAHTRAAYDKKLYLYLLKIIEKLEDRNMGHSVSRPNSNPIRKINVPVLNGPPVGSYRPNWS
jgi:hypothetical protein